MGFPGGTSDLPANAGDPRDMSPIPGWRRSPGVGYGTTLPYSCPESSMGRGAWRATVHGAAKSQIQLNTCVFTHMHTAASIVTISDRACQTAFQRALPSFYMFCKYSVKNAYCGKWLLFLWGCISVFFGHPAQLPQYSVLMKRRA